MTEIQLVIKFSDFIILKNQFLNQEIVSLILDEDELNEISIDFGHPFSFKEQTLEFQLEDGSYIVLEPIYSGELKDDILYGFIEATSEVRFYNPVGFNENDFELAFETFFRK